ncbi:atp-binding cassette transporter [Phaffia rhodozyma]|uniref:Iron-sulfur clusters transporter ATM1, mitochondrial n=1 Tax=Phaffia rhodozyma TaxID=264483 RepID=A0A0F7SI41_PHARH|nr:atp-binding cassette transporter [Phaffia rhodozyma]
MYLVCGRASRLLYPTLNQASRRPIRSSPISSLLSSSHRSFSQSHLVRSQSPPQTPASFSFTSPESSSKPASPVSPAPPTPLPPVSPKKTQNSTDWSIIRTLVKNIWPKSNNGVKVRVVLALGLLIGGKVMNVQVPFFFKEIVDGLNLPMTESGTVWMVAGWSIVGYGVARVLSTLFSELRNAVFASVAQGAIRKVARETFQHLLAMDLKFHLTRQTGGLTRAIDRGTKGISFVLSSVLFHVIPTALEISMVCGILTWRYGWDFAAVTAATMGAYTWFTVSTTAWRTQFRKKANEADNKGATLAVDSLINFEAVKHFNNEKFEIAQYDKTLGNYEAASTKIATSLAYLNSGQNIIFTSALTIMMGLAAQGISKGTMTVGDLVMINQLVFQLSLPLNFLGTVYRELRQSLIDMDVLFGIQKLSVPIKDTTLAKPLDLKGGSISFKNVSFSYHPDRPIFKDLSFTIPAGKKVAIVGTSGSGKSTLFRLIYRFYEPSSGEISIDGQPIDSIELDSLRRAIGVVPQDTPLFHADILHNVRYGRLDATDEEVKEACRKAHVEQTIESLPEKYLTKVGERGLMISGGEKQRLAVARVLLKDPPILFFDEATSALDSETERALMADINSMLVDNRRTSVFIAHRLRTISDADHIIVLHQGVVAEEGTHEELLARSPENGAIYKGLWDTQASIESGQVDKE